ncbi:MAG: R3H domain protein [Smithella sp. PtaU1.Bin162]|nr:MAG: R3H domain protein [Smithella sp. PtaU1.Bin162]
MSSKTLEIEGKTIDAAIETACREFNVPREKLNIEIISEGNGGFWGVLSKKAKIRASLLSLDVSFDLNVKENAPAKTAAHVITSAKDAPVLPTREIKAAAAPAAVPAVTVLSADSSAPKAKELLAGILQRMSFECQVAVQETPEKIILNIEGDGSGLLIGKRGQNLDAIQYILNKAINRSDTDRKMIMVDSEAYRKRREESLMVLAERIREKVKKTKRPVSLSNMNAHDRRIIHLALQEDETLTTKSRGEGEYRKIVILPAKRGNAVHHHSRRQTPGGQSTGYNKD